MKSNRPLLENGYVRLSMILMAYSLVIFLLAQQLNIDKGSIYNGYYEKPNWFLFILYWVPAIYFYQTTWKQFEEAWNDLFSNGCIVPSSDKRKEQSAEFIAYISGHRKYILVASFILGTIVMYFDMKNIYDIYTSNPTQLYQIVDKEKDTADVVSYYINKPIDKPNRTIDQISIKDVYDKIGKNTDGIYLSKVKDATWTEAWLFEPYVNNVVRISKIKNCIYVIAAYLQQYIIVIAGFCSLFHIWAHLVYFVRFDELPVAKKYNLNLRLDPYSKIHEFGLERWNQSLNIIYWALSPVLLIPILSKSSQADPNTYDIGQIMIKWLVPLLFLSPMLFTLIARQTKSIILWETIRNEDDEDKIDRYHSQLLWPLDKNWASKLGILISFILLSYLIGDILKQLGADKIIKI